MKKKTLFLFPLLLVCAVGTLLITTCLPSGADFNPNNLIDDYTFDNTNTLNAGQINAFLNGFSNSCISPNHGFTAPDPSGYSPNGGYTYGGNVTAGQVIYDAAQAYNLNPQVLLATLQKEQTLVSGGSGCSTLRYVGALGYGCPDGGTEYSYSGVNLYSINGNQVTSVSGTCVNSAAKAGFSQQIIHAAWLLKFGEQRSEGNVSWAEIHGSWNNSDDPPTCYTGPMTQGNRQQCQTGSSVYYDGYTTIDGSSTHMDTGATAALYWYTPHFNGNENFETIFQTWFGPTTGQGYELAISDNTSDLRQWVVYNNIKQYIPDSQTLDAWGLNNATLTTMPAAQLAAIPTGPTLDRLMVLGGGNQSIYFVDGGKRYLVQGAAEYNAWNFSGRVISGVSAGLFSLPTDGGTLPYSVKASGGSTVYMLDGGYQGQTVLRPYQSIAMFNAWEGDNASYLTLDSGSGFYDQIDNAIGSSLTSTKASCNGTEFQIMSGTRVIEPSNVAGLYPGSAQSVSAATFGRLGQNGKTASEIVQSTASPAVYLIDNGQKHQLLWPSILTSWEAAGQPIEVVTPGYLATIPTDSSIGGYLGSASGQLYVMDSGHKVSVPSALATSYGGISSAYAATASLLALFPTTANAATSYIQGTNSPSVYLLDNSGKLRHFEYPDKVTLWGGYKSGITYLSDYIVSSIGTAASPGVFVSDGTTSYVMENGQKWTVASPVQTAWNLSSPQVYSDSTLNLFPTGGALTTTEKDGTGAYFLISGGVAYATTDPNIAGDWALTAAPTHDDALIRSLLPGNMLTRFVRSSVDSRLFMVDNGNWYNLPTAQAANVGATGQPTMTLNPSLAPNSITDWSSQIVKSSADAYYVVDGGTKRLAPNSIIINQWDNNGSIAVPTMTTAWLNLLPTGQNIERTIKGSSPSVYFVYNNTKEHILFPQTYQTNYAPFTNVSDQLLAVLSNGIDIY